MSDNQNQTESTGYEKSDVNVSYLIKLAISLVVVIVIVVVLLNEFFVVSREEIFDQVVLSPQSKALRELRAHEDEVLGSYGVVDAKKGVYRIPIDRAMKLVADEAFAKRTEGKN